MPVKKNCIDMVIWKHCENTTEIIFIDHNPLVSNIPLYFTNLRFLFVLSPDDNFWI